jgi:hypothetical protein
MLKAAAMMFFGMISAGPLMQVFAQVNITGTVVDQTGAPALGVTVSLNSQSLSATTDAAGHYQMGSTFIRGTNGFKTQNRRCVLDKGILKFGINDTRANVRIKMYDALGNTIASLLEKDLTRGEYSIAAVSPTHASQLYFLTVKIGNDEQVIMMPMVRNNPLHKAMVMENSAPELIGLGKTTALPDTVRTMKTGYAKEFKVIASYTGVVNFIITDTAWFWGNRASIPAASQVMTYVYLNRTYGAYTDAQVYWNTGGQTKTIAQQATFDMGANSSGRVNFNLGTSTGQYADFIEHTISSSVWNGNTTRVDGWGLPILIRLHCKDGYDVILGDQYHIFAMKRDSVFALFKRSVPAEFQSCANNGSPYRIIAPGKGEGSFAPGQTYANYMNAYLASIGQSGSTTNQVFSCAGNPFGSNAALAGAVNRHVAQLPQSSWSNVSLYYQAAPANFYAKFWHENSVDSKCYGFAYDDAAEQAAYASHGQPQYLIIAIGY